MIIVRDRYEIHFMYLKHQETDEATFNLHLKGAPCRAPTDVPDAWISGHGGVKVVATLLSDTEYDNSSI